MTKFKLLFFQWLISYDFQELFSISILQPKISSEHAQHLPGSRNLPLKNNYYTTVTAKNYKSINTKNNSAK